MNASLRLLMCLICLFSLFGASELWSAQLGRVDVEDAPVLETPTSDAKVLEKLKKGVALAASDIPTQGYYKVRTPSGIVGWVSSDILIFAPAPPAEPLSN